MVARVGFDTTENESSKVCQKVVRQLDQLSKEERRWLPSLLPCAFTVVLGVVILWSRTPALVAFAGSACLVVNVVMYAGPLAGIHRALTSKSTEFLPFSLGLTTVLCATPWLCFGVAVNNRNIYIPNTIGVICGSCQVVVWIYVSRIEDKMSDRSDERSPLEEGSLKTT